MGNTLQKPGQNHSENIQEQELQVTELPDESQPFTCEICIEPMLLPNKKFKNQNHCVHPFCIDCIVKYITIKLEDNVGNIPCPSLNCNQFLDPISCRNLVGPQLFVKWSDVLCESAVLTLAQCYCPNPNCSALILDECGENAKRSQCPNCKNFFCFQCKLPWHAGFQCGELRDGNDVAFGMLAELNKWKRCPTCRHIVQLIEGCKIVKCRCGANFCYNCGKRVYKHWCGCDPATRWWLWLIQCFCLMFVILALLLCWDIQTSKRSKN
ncbi:E3 ubiquitin-protein ligase RSL1-like isoform X1 [Lycium barbarum]|uniref:E3 ubiquitin-protein ligase RSL1-like isoform X1 n=1 Tax=Lycium barbarum TaxID=112863 RepID=UPI00293E1407|nr:E3 ubiquitin-protein ligase RSL1-like isoform X1 [Lycium barbarum]